MIPLQRLASLAPWFTLSAAPALGAGDCGTSVSVDSRTEWYFSDSDMLSSVTLNPLLLPVPYWVSFAVGVGDVLRTTNCASLNFMGLNVSAGSGSDHSTSFDFSSFMPAAGSAAAQFAEEGFEVHGAVQQLRPSVAPCTAPRVGYYTHPGGSANALAMHAGLGPYPRKISRSHFSLCRELVFENHSTDRLEIPVTISGDVSVYGSFTVDSANYAKAKLSIQGSIGGETISAKAEVRE